MKNKCNSQTEKKIGKHDIALYFCKIPSVSGLIDYHFERTFCIFLFFSAFAKIYLFY